MKHLVYFIIFTVLFSSCAKPAGGKIDTGKTSIEKRISDYAQHAFIHNHDDEIKDIFTLDIKNFNAENKEALPEDGIYKKDYFQIFVPASMYVIASEVRDGVILKHKEKPAYIYLLSPLWSASSVYLCFDFNNSEFKHISGYRDVTMNFSGKKLVCEYIFPEIRDKYTRYVKINKHYDYGMTVLVLIYREPDVSLEEMKSISEAIMSKYGVFADH
ncbi:MAG: hypothetical protein JW881_20590 [Spirochaetales bacterium]|nr:hypothetical protein [Spirochaetales bacterium]